MLPVIFAAFLIGCGLILYEWLFYVTQPFVAALFGWRAALVVLLDNLSVIWVILLLLLVLFLFLMIITRPMLPVPRARLLRSYWCLAGGLTGASLVVNFVDDSLYTFTRFGISTSTSVWSRLCWLILFLVSALLIFARIFNLTSGLLLRRVAIGVLLVIIPVLLVRTISTFSQDNVATTNKAYLDGLSQNFEDSSNLPNIIILSFDGIDADRMSAFGYEKNTTPFLESHLSEFLVARDFYTNSANTTGSVVSMLTGVLPTSTKVLYRPDFLLNEYAYLHLPGILKNLGYNTLDSSVRHYTDPYELNLRNGFDFANGRKSAQWTIPRTDLFQIFMSSTKSQYFVERTFSRVRERLLHLLNLGDRINPYESVTNSGKKQSEDMNRLDMIKAFASQQIELRHRFFINTHFMGSHGPRFRLVEPFFSKDLKQTEDFQLEFYDDAVLQIDSRIAEFYSWLEDAGILDSTILIITSDHGIRYSRMQRIPLLIRTPFRQFTGVVPGTWQRLDIAPTLLDLIQVPQAPWFEGESILSGLDAPIDPKRPVIATSARSVHEGSNKIWQVKTLSEQYGSIGTLSLISCDRYFEWNLDKDKISSHRLEHRQGYCSNMDSMNAEQAKSILEPELRPAGF